jgi:hypothetical protein
MAREQGFGRIQDALLGGKMGGVQTGFLGPRAGMSSGSIVWNERLNSSRTAERGSNLPVGGED